MEQNAKSGPGRRPKRQYIGWTCDECNAFEQPSTQSKSAKIHPVGCHILMNSGCCGQCWSSTCLKRLPEGRTRCHHCFRTKARTFGGQLHLSLFSFAVDQTMNTPNIDSQLVWYEPRIPTEGNTLDLLGKWNQRLGLTRPLDSCSSCPKVLVPSGTFACKHISRKSDDNMEHLGMLWTSLLIQKATNYENKMRTNQPTKVSIFRILQFWPSSFWLLGVPFWAFTLDR